MKLYFSFIFFLFFKNLIKSFGLQSNYSNIIDSEKKNKHSDMIHPLTDDNQKIADNGRKPLISKTFKDNLKEDQGKILNIDKLKNLKDKISKIQKNLDVNEEESEKLEKINREIKKKTDYIMNTLGKINGEINSNEEKEKTNVASIGKNLRKIPKERSEPGGEYEETNTFPLPWEIPKNKGKSKLKKFTKFSLDNNILDKFNKVYQLLKQEHHLPVKTVGKKERKETHCNLNKYDFTILRPIQENPNCDYDEVYDPILRLCVNVDCIPEENINLYNSSDN